MQPWERERPSSKKVQPVSYTKQVVKHIGKIFLFSGVVYICAIKHYVNLRKTK